MRTVEGRITSRNHPTRPKRWSVDEKDVREDVQLALPKEWKLRVFAVVSGDTGNEYWVQILKNKTISKPICLCDCAGAKFVLPLLTLGLKDPCKHAQYVLDNVVIGAKSES